MKIFAVDDDSFILELLTEALGVAGHSNVTTCNDPLEAARSLSSGSMTYDCFIVDIQMPEMDGVDLVRHIRSIPDYRLTPVLMVTAMADKQHINDAFAAGANDYVTKPFDIFELAEKVSLVESAATDAKNVVAVLDCGHFSDRATFQNYVAQLARRGAPHSVVAIEFQAAPGTDDADLPNALSIFARLINRLLVDEPYLASYVGSGRFVCAHQGEKHRFDSLFALSLNEVMRKSGCRALRDGAVSKLGDTVRGRLFRKIDAAEIVDRAISSLDLTADHEAHHLVHAV